MEKSHEIIYIDDYAIIVSDDDIEIGDRRLDLFNMTIGFCINEKDKTFLNKRLKGVVVFKKIIASTKLTWIPETPLFSLPNEINKLIREYFNGSNSINLDIYENKDFAEFIYKAVQKKYSEEDLRDAIMYGYQTCMRGGNIDKDKYVESLNKSKKPISCIVEYETIWARNTDRNVPTEADFDYKPKIENGKLVITKFN